MDIEIKALFFAFLIVLNLATGLGFADEPYNLEVKSVLKVAPEGGRFFPSAYPIASDGIWVREHEYEGPRGQEDLITRLDQSGNPTASFHVPDLFRHTFLNSLIQLSDGALVIADEPNGLRLFDPEGKVVSSVGKFPFGLGLNLRSLQDGGFALIDRHSVIVYTAQGVKLSSADFPDIRIEDTEALPGSGLLVTTEKHLYWLDSQGKITRTQAIPDGGSARSTLFLEDGDLLVVCGYSQICRLDPSGNLKWEYTIDSGYILRQSRPGVLADGTIIIGMKGNLDANPNGKLLFLNPNGSLKTEIPVNGDPSMITPARLDNDVIVAGSIEGSSRETLYFLNAEGKELAQFQFSSGGSGISPIALPNHTLVAVGDWEVSYLKRGIR